MAASTPEFHSLFHLPLSSQAYNQFLKLTSDVQGLELSDLSDAWSYIWGSSFFSAKRVYTHLIGHRNVHRAFKWLLLKDRLSTRALLRRQRMHLTEYTCVLCHLNADEDLLLFL